ncbi:hypothetical protein [Streptomyces sp. NPDC003077]|uniref:hypothetical protein n=1 Tax=Streptomyces sp. NPDC003077 TaxID=3154443 RepID=UPI0033AA49D9
MSARGQDAPARSHESEPPPRFRPAHPPDRRPAPGRHLGPRTPPPAPAATDEAAPIAARSAVLPDWAIDRIRDEFTRPRLAGQPLLRLTIPDARPGMDARTHVSGKPLEPMARRAVILAELHLDALSTLPTGAHPEAVAGDDWPGFFHRTHHLLAGGGLLLIAARQQRIAGRLCDPLGALVAGARAAGFTYLQHIVVVHGHLSGDRIEPTPPPGMPTGLVHSDLLAFAADQRH